MKLELEVVKEFRFEAAHVLPKHPGKCSRLHGHSWLMRVGVTAPINRETGFVVDYIDLKAMVQPLVDVWDHSFLGAYPKLEYITATGGSCFGAVFTGYPSSEYLVAFVVDYLLGKVAQLPGQIPGDAMSSVRLTLVEIEETCTSRCTWRAK